MSAAPLPKREWQRCKGCGKEWPKYRADGRTLGLFTLLARLPAFYLHFKFFCPARGAR